MKSLIIIVCMCIYFSLSVIENSVIILSYTATYHNGNCMVSSPIFCNRTEECFDGVDKQ